VPAESGGSIEDVYRERLAARRVVGDAREREHVRLSRIRLGLVTVAVGIPIIGGLDALSWSAVPAALFGLVAVVHAVRLDERRRAASAVAFYERGLARLTHAWIGHGDQGERFRQPGHLYADDLDLFGRGSLFELVGTGRTEAGQSMLARWLLAPAEPDTVRLRQAAVRELVPRLDLRERIAVLGEGLAVGVDADGLRAWASSPHRFGRRWERALAAALPAIWIGLIGWIVLAGSMTLVALRALVVLLVAQSVVALWFRSRVLPVIGALEGPTRDLALLSGVLETLEGERFESPRLVEIQRAVLGPRRASREIRRLGQLAALLASRTNLMFALPAALLLWATQFAAAIEAWRGRAGRHVPGWLDAVGEFEALVALATFAGEHPGYVYPELTGDTRGIEATSIAHPLLPADAVPNDLALGAGELSLFIISGSNMSGKSTWLRAVGVNVVLAGAGAPVRAASMHLAPLAVGAAMRVSDSLVDGQSHFMAEITRLKQIVDLARARPGRVLFLLDEVLGGTNSHDRRHGAEGLLSGLLALDAIGLVTTHDLTLGELADALAPAAANVHFEDSFDGSRLMFDYRLRPGIVRTSNAIALMRSIGLDV